MKLEDLVGTHMLSGVDRITEDKRDRWNHQNPEVLRFELDGVLYGAVEDPEDGYRSAMRELRVYNERPANTFTPVRVQASMRPDGEGRWGERNNVLDVSYNGQLILSVGTGDTNDYYPYFVANWNPKPLGIVNDTGA